MADIRYGHHTAEIDGDFVVFVIGARPSLRHPIRTFLDLGGRRGMTAMLKELSRDPEKGLLGFQSSGLLIVQYWRSFEHLEAFARDPGDLHRPAWLNYYRRAARHEGTGIWHETYLVRAGEYEAIYHNMPPHGLATAGRMVPLKESTTARLRLRRARTA
ncbi:DUF4188 domain-containing protein [Pseudonocardia halophobica]|uniref:Transcriptional regulator n=1 Tax=Pseudonocardia halophobica TaxID=29401 RepID=A0A9W6L269_9PSEU|nr:DUF4188 domain-containing protein [Pseudonocardia halophobica]GLL11557.1 transcriptional regulator [Pseudonocardia halophobica]